MPTGTPCSGPMRPPLGLVTVERARLRQRMLGIEMDEGLHVAFDRRDPVQAGARIVLGRHRAARDFGSGFGCGQCCSVCVSQIAPLFPQLA